MKIAFWSNADGPSSVSANLAAVSVISAICYPYIITVMENHISSNNLGEAYFNDNTLKLVRESGYYYEGGGIEGMLRKIYRGEFSKELVDYYRKTIINDHLYYIPQSKVINNNTFSYELFINLVTFFDLLEEATDVLFIDTDKDNISTNSILEESDLIVINLNHNSVIHEKFFQENSHLSNKSIFLVGKTPNENNIISRNISELYNIPLELIVEIPYNEMFEVAIRMGRVVEFILCNYQCSKNEYNYPFIQSIEKAAELIMEKVFLEERRRSFATT